MSKTLSIKQPITIYKYFDDKLFITQNAHRKIISKPNENGFFFKNVT